MWQGCQQSRGSGKHRMHNKSRSAAGAVVCAIGAVLVGVILIGVILRRRLVAACGGLLGVQLHAGQRPQWKCES